MTVGPGLLVSVQQSVQTDLISGICQQLSNNQHSFLICHCVPVVVRGMVLISSRTAPGLPDHSWNVADSAEIDME